MLGFSFNLASAFTATFSRKWGERRGTLATIVLRDVLGIPVWAIGLGLAFIAPSPVLFASTAATNVSGWGAIGVGAVIIVVALATIRMRAVRPSAKDTLAENGLYAYVRHPIHGGTFLELVGLFIIRPSRANAVACALGILWVLLQTWLEERDLLQRIPAYREYMLRVPPFVPRLSRRAKETR